VIIAGKPWLQEGIKVCKKHKKTKNKINFPLRPTKIIKRSKKAILVPACKASLQEKSVIDTCLV
jgi:hypothetical protein